MSRFLPVALAVLSVGAVLLGQRDWAVPERVLRDWQVAAVPSSLTALVLGLIEIASLDLVFTMQTPMSLMRLGALERQLSDLVGIPVDLVPDAALRPEFRDRVLAEAVAL